MEAHRGVHGVVLFPGQGQRRWPDPRVYRGGLQADAKGVMVRKEPREKAHFRNQVLRLR